MVVFNTLPLVDMGSWAVNLEVRQDFRCGSMAFAPSAAQDIACVVLRETSEMLSVSNGLTFTYCKTSREFVITGRYGLGY